MAVAYAISLPLSISVNNVLFVIGIVLWVLSFIAARFAGKAQSIEENAATATLPLLKSFAPLLIPIAMMAMAVTISGAFNGGAGEAWRSLRSLWSLLPYFWAYHIFSSRQLCARIALNSLLIVSSIAGIWGSIQQIFNIHSGYQYLQGTGFIAHPMSFAGQMQIFSMLSLGLLLSGGYKFKGAEETHPIIRKCILDPINSFPVFMVIVIANFAGLLFASERSAWLGGVAGVLAIAALKSAKFALKAIAGMIAFGTMSYLFIPVVKTRIDTLLSGNDISVTVRKAIWSDCLNIYFPKSPFVGIGWLKFPHFTSEWFQEHHLPEAMVPGVSKDLNHAHSNYIHILTTSGILGISCFLFLIASSLKLAFDKYRRALKEEDSFAAGTALGIFGVAVSMAVSGIFEYNFFTAQVRLAQWFVLGLL